MSNRLKHERNFHREEEYDSENEEEELTDDEVEKESLASEPETVIRQREEEDGADSAWSFGVMEAVLAAELRVKKKKKKRKKKKHTVSRQLDYNNTQTPWDSRNYLQMVANEYGGPCGDMHLLDDSIIPYDMLL